MGYSLLLSNLKELSNIVLFLFYFFFILLSKLKILCVLRINENLTFYFLLIREEAWIPIDKKDLKKFAELVTSIVYS